MQELAQLGLDGKLQSWVVAETNFAQIIKKDGSWVPKVSHQNIWTDDDFFPIMRQPEFFNRKTEVRSSVIC